MKILNLKKVLFGLAISLVLAMAIGSFALGETQTPANTQAKAQNISTSNDDYDTGDFDVEGGTPGEDNDYAYIGGVLYIHPQSSDINITVKNKESVEKTGDRIIIGPEYGKTIADTVNITLAGVNIDNSSRAPIIIGSDVKDIKILLEDDTTNTLVSTSDSAAGLSKENTEGNLIIGVPDGQKGNGKLVAKGGKQAAGIGNSNREDTTNITITGGDITAYGGGGAAGIGGRDGKNIKITGGIVTAIGGYYSYQGDNAGAGIGGGSYGSGSDGNSISGDAVVFAASGGSDSYAPDNKKPALEGFGDSDSGITGGIVFTGVGTEFDSDGRATNVSWDENSSMKGDVALSSNMEIPVSLTVPTGKTLSIEKGKEVTIVTKNDAKLIVEGELQNNGTLTLPTSLEVKENGTITTLLNYDPQGGEIVTTNDDNYITYQNKSGVKKYENLPDATKEGCDFDGWYDKAGGQGTKVEEGNSILLNEHILYANWIENPTPTPPTPTPPGPEPQPTPPGPEPGPTPEPTPDPSVDPDGDDGSGSSSKTSDPFMGGIALALLGVATTGAVLVRKRK